VRLSWISVADKPGYNKGGKGVASEEKLWVVKLRQSRHLCGLNLVNLILNNSFCQRMCQSGMWNINLHLLDGSFDPPLQRCLRVSNVNVDK